MVKAILLTGLLGLGVLIGDGITVTSEIVIESVK